MSRILLFSDSHGVAAAMKALRARVEADAPDLVCFLGDALYHGPRNGVPLDYDTKASAEAFNAMAERIVAVRGNCDAEIDQAVLQFPILADYALLSAGERLLFVTHGHLFHLDALPPLHPGDILLHGHTHVPACETRDGVTYLNPGSLAIPKADSPHSYMTLEDGVFLWKDLLTGAVYRE